MGEVKATRPSERKSKIASWSIAIASSWVNLFVFAVFRSSGVLYLVLQDEFHATRAQASWPTTLSSSIGAISCLPAGFLAHFFTVRTIVSAGIITTALSVIICFWAASMNWIILSLGVLQGIGVGSVACLLPVIISEYFGSQRAAACGLSYAGAGVGAFIFPLTFQFLINNYGFNYSMLIMGGVVLIALLGSSQLTPFVEETCASLFEKSSTDEETLGRKLQSPRCIEARKLMDTCGTGNETASASTITWRTASVVDEEKENQEEIVNQSVTCSEDRFGEPVFHVDSCINCETCLRKEGDLEEVRETADKPARDSILCMPDVTTSYVFVDDNFGAPCENNNAKVEREQPLLQISPSGELSMLNEVTFHREIVSCSETPLEDSQDEMDESKLYESKEKIDGERSQMASCVCASSGCTLNVSMTSKMKSEEEHQSRSFLQMIEKQIAVDARVLLQLPFALISLTYIAYLMGNVTFLMILPVYVNGLGKSVPSVIESNITLTITRYHSPLVRPELGVFMLSLFSVTDLIGRLLPGWLSYYSKSKWLSNKSLYITSIGSMGLLHLSFPILFNSSTNSLGPMANEIILTLLTLACGLVSGFQMILPPVLIAESLGPQHTAIAFGFANCIYGLLSFTRPMIIGFFSGSYEPVFYVFGSFALISCLAWFTEIIIPPKTPSSSPSSCMASTSPA